jgi:hypothetical protein
MINASLVFPKLILKKYLKKLLSYKFDPTRIIYFFTACKPCITLGLSTHCALRSALMSASARFLNSERERNDRRARALIFAREKLNFITICSESGLFSKKNSKKNAKNVLNLRIFQIC